MLSELEKALRLNSRAFGSMLRDDSNMSHSDYLKAVRGEKRSGNDGLYEKYFGDYVPDIAEFDTNADEKMTDLLCESVSYVLPVKILGAQRIYDASLRENHTVAMNFLYMFFVPRRIMKLFDTFARVHLADPANTTKFNYVAAELDNDDASGSEDDEDSSPSITCYMDKALDAAVHGKAQKVDFKLRYAENMGHCEDTKENREPRDGKKTRRKKGGFKFPGYYDKAFDEMTAFNTKDSMFPLLTEADKISDWGGIVAIFTSPYVGEDNDPMAPSQRASNQWKEAKRLRNLNRDIMLAVISILSASWKEAMAKQRKKDAKNGRLSNRLMTEKKHRSSKRYGGDDHNATYKRSRKNRTDDTPDSLDDELGNGLNSQDDHEIETDDGWVW